MQIFAHLQNVLQTKNNSLAKLFIIDVLYLEQKLNKRFL